MIEHRGDHDKRDGVAKGEAMVAPVGQKDVLRLISNTVAIRHDAERRFDLQEKRARSLEISSTRRQA
ncbi:MAG: hypothetical protein P0121_01475 [Nitrospira sp.]|nr:hypothetical protein [Nitrospira sp.]